jgi:uncharacterized phage protein (TIGR02220 family)
MKVAWMPLDFAFFGDARVIYLAKRLGWSVGDAGWAFLRCCAEAYQRDTECLPEPLLDAIANHDGFGAELVAVSLARVTGDGDALRLAGLADRMGKIRQRSLAGQTAGLASAAKRNAANTRPTTVQRQVNDRANNRSTIVNHSEKERERSPLGVSSGSEISASQKSEESPLTPPPSSSRKPKRKGPVLTYETLDQPTRQSVDNILERLEKRSGVAYTKVNAHVDLIAARLAEGYSEMDLRAVIGWVSADVESGGRGWEKDDKFRAYISPKTLFGPKKIEEYIDQSRAWLRRNHPGLVTPSTSVPDGRHATKTEAPQSPTGVPETGAGGPPTRRDRDEYQPLFGGLLDERR